MVEWQGGRCRAPTGSAWDNTLTTTVAYDNRSKVDGILDGLLLSLQWQYGPSWLGTGNDYHLVAFNGMFAKRFFKEHNLIVRLAADLDFDPPFKQEVEAGGPQLRGFIVRQVPRRHLRAHDAGVHPAAVHHLGAVVPRHRLLRQQLDVVP